LGKPFSYVDLYDALDLTQTLCRLRRLESAFVYYREPFEVKKEKLLPFLFKDFSIKPALGFEFLSQYINLLLVNPYKGIKFLLLKSSVIYPQIEVFTPKKSAIEIKGVENLPPAAVSELTAALKLAKKPEEIVELLRKIYRRYGFDTVKVELKRKNGKTLVVVKEGKRYPFVVLVFLKGKKLFTSEEFTRYTSDGEVLKTVEKKLLTDYGIKVESYTFERKRVKDEILLIVRVNKYTKYDCQTRLKVKTEVKGLKDYLEEILENYSCYALALENSTVAELKNTLLNVLDYYSCLNATAAVKTVKEGNRLEVVVEASCPAVRTFGKTAFWVEGKLPSREVKYILPNIEGKRFNPKLVNLLSKKFSETGLFQTYTLKRVRLENRETLLVEAVEKSPFEISGAAEYSTDEGYSLRTTATFYDLLKTGERFDLNLYYGQKRTTYSLSYFDNYFFSHRYFAGASLFKKYEEHRDFDLNSRGFSLSFGCHLGYYADLSLNYIYNNFSLENYEAAFGGGKEVKYALNLRVEYPIYRGILKRGEFLSFTEISYSPNFGGFKKFENKFGISYNFKKLFTDFKLSFGAVSESAPPFEKFYLGGFKDLKGYTYEAVAPYGGGNYYWYVGTEIGVPVAGGFYIFSGFDSGNSVNSTKNLFKNIKSDIFLGAGTVTAIGPIRLGVAFPYENNQIRLKDFKIFMLVGFQF
jgi:outer membrane protein insertion porin family